MRTAPALFLASALALSACKSELDDKPTAQVKDPAPATEEHENAEASTDSTLEIDPAKSEVAFVGAKVTGDHRGTFSDFEGEVRLRDGSPEAMSLAVRVSSLQVEPDKLRGHLLSADFFDAEKIPEAKFVSKEIRESSGGDASHEVEGDLTLHGVTKTISFPANIEIDDQRAHGKTQFKINRKDFEIDYPGMPNDLIKDDVLLDLDLVAPVKSDAS